MVAKDFAATFPWWRTHIRLNLRKRKMRLFNNAPRALKKRAVHFYAGMVVIRKHVVAGEDRASLDWREHCGHETVCR
jgi:hypothetical protein